MRPLRELLHSVKVERANTPIPRAEQLTAFLYIPEYAASRVTASLDEQTVKPKAVYRIAVDPKKANPRFLAQILNGPYGKQLRAYTAKGITIQRCLNA